MKVPRGFSSRFFQSEFLPSFFFLFFSSSPGNEFLSRHHDHGWKSTKAHSSGVLPTRITRYPSITMSFPFADRMPRDLPFSFSRSASTVISPLRFSPVEDRFLSDSRDSRDFHRWIIASSIVRAYNLKSFHHASKYTRWLRFIRVARIVFHVVWSVESGWLDVNSAS